MPSALPIRKRRGFLHEGRAGSLAAPDGSRPQAELREEAAGARMVIAQEIRVGDRLIISARVQVAAITRRAEGYFIVHVDSETAGDYPLVNGSAIGAQARKLQDNDVIQLAGVKMGFFEG